MRKSALRALHALGRWLVFRVQCVPNSSLSTHTHRTTGRQFDKWPCFRTLTEI